MTANEARAVRALEALEMGGRTPLAEGMALGLRALRQERLKVPETALVMVVLSDGRPNLTVAGGHPFDEAVELARRAGRAGVALAFVDSEDDPMASGCGHAIATAAGGAYEFLSALE